MLWRWLTFPRKAEDWTEQSAVLYLKVLSVPLRQLITFNAFASVNDTCCATVTTKKKQKKQHLSSVMLFPRCEN